MTGTRNSEGATMMFDHVSIGVRDIAKAKAAKLGA
jgi:hypothetical protein